MLPMSDITIFKRSVSVAP